MNQEPKEFSGATFEQKDHEHSSMEEPKDRSCCPKCSPTEGDYVGMCAFSHCPCHTKAAAEWETRFEKEVWYSNQEGLNGTLITGKDMPELKRFMSRLLKEQKSKDREEIIKEIMGRVPLVPEDFAGQQRWQERYRFLHDAVYGKEVTIMSDVNK